MRKTSPIALLATLLLTGLFVGCKSTKEEGVTSNMRTQWTMVSADTKTTAAAAQAVLEAEGMKDVSSSATAVDGVAKGKKADGTEIHVAIKKKTDTSSEVSVTVGTLGDPTLGASIVKQIKERAEKK